MAWDRLPEFSKPLTILYVFQIILLFFSKISHLFLHRPHACALSIQLRVFLTCHKFVVLFPSFPSECISRGHVSVAANHECKLA